MSSRVNPQEVYREVRGWCEDARVRLNRTAAKMIYDETQSLTHHTRHVTIRGNLTVLSPSTAKKVMR